MVFIKKVLYTGDVKIFLLLIVLLFPCFASAQTIGEAIKGAKEIVLGTECEQRIKEATRDTQIIVWAANKADWDTAFRYREAAWQEILIAQSYCEDDSEQLQIADDLMHDHDTIDQALVCTYHASETQERLKKTNKAIENDDWESAFFHANWSTYHVEEALRFCEYNPKRIEILINLKEHAYAIVSIIESQIKADGGG